MKNEMFYHCWWDNVSVEQFIEGLDNYLRWYNEERIKISLGGMSLITYRCSLGLAVWGSTQVQEDIRSPRGSLVCCNHI
ncbi:MAG TPA: IS3 family transposase [Firmicutes bacterium]|jgi:hypothetical protein|nr:IS3 family transposase [Bacillota bacterium]